MVLSTSTSLLVLSRETQLRVIRQHYTHRGYEVHSGLQFGCEYVLYATSPSRVHSDFAIHVAPTGTVPS
jgi:tRNA splicing endonuclease